MSSSLPDGFRARRPEESDVAIVAGIIHAEEQDLRGRSSWGVEETVDWWRLSNKTEGTWIAETVDAVPAAFAATIEQGDSVNCWASVHPEFAGRGLATALLARCEERARRLGRATMKVGAFVENGTALRLFEALGFREARHFFHMQIDFDGPPDPPRWPPKMRVVTFRREEARAFHEALDEAFAEDWGHVSMDFEEWKRFRVEAPGVDLSLWFVAWQGDQIAGVCRCNANQYDGGYIGALGVRKAWRNRGLGLALLQHAFREFHRRGETHVGLGVDAANPTGATRLYERAGMRVLTEDVVFEKELR